MLLGLVMLALPLSIIGTNFIEERANMIREMESEKMGENEVVEAQSLKTQLEDTIDVINEILKYQELIAESMGDAVKIIAAAKAQQVSSLTHALVVFFHVLSQIAESDIVSCCRFVDKIKLRPIAVLCRWKQKIK